MKNVFNKAQRLKSSEYCKKFSKSVSYETLVGGTTTTGTEYKQTRRLSKGSANKPLTAVGTLTSLLCNSAKVMEKLLHRHSERSEGSIKNDIKDWILRLRLRMTTKRRLRMTIPVLALIFTFVTISESRAGCRAQELWNNDCYDSWKPGEANNCGDGCTYTYNNGKLTVTATKPDAVIPKGMFSPLFYEPNVYPNVTDIEIDGEFESIKVNAFLDAGANISGKDGVLHLKNVAYSTVQGNTLTGTIIISDQVETIAGQWYLATLNGTLILPPTIKSIYGMLIWGLKLGENAKIYCGAENCEELFKNVDCDKIEEPYVTGCKNKLKTLLASGKLLAYPDGCAKMGASGCTKCKNENFKLNDGECDRLRWTPAEAAKVLTDDNNNSVTITFKK